jgi:DNA-binding NarL/FixJ family response regulator
MQKTITTLFVDKEPLYIDNYLNSITSFFKKVSINFITASNCEQAYQVIKQKNTIDYLILDVQLDPFKAKKINCGFDLALFFKEKFPKAKIIFVTAINQGHKLYQIITKINPIGILHKCDINTALLHDVFHKIIVECPCYMTPTVNVLMKEYHKQQLLFDAIDLEIVRLLEQGIKTKNLPKYLGITLSAIEKRKAKIKEQILVQKGNDKELIAAFKKLNLL